MMRGGGKKVKKFSSLMHVKSVEFFLSDILKPKKFSPKIYEPNLSHESERKANLILSYQNLFEY